jgi:ABC-type antimicrobial peptide transport system permease subunit
VQDLDRALPTDYSTFVLAVGISLAAGIIAGLYPAWRIGRATPASYLKVQ